MNTSLVILAGGASSRMKSSQTKEAIPARLATQANSLHKGLIELGSEGKPLAYFLVKNAEMAGYRTIYFLVGEDSGPFREQFSNNAEFNNIEIKYAIQFIPSDREKPFGTADAVFQTMEQHPELQTKKFTVCNCDNLYSVKAMQVLSKSSSTHGTIAYDKDFLQFSSERISKFAVMQFNSDYQLLEIVEKPEKVKMNSFKDKEGKIRISMNIFAFNGKIIFKYLNDCPVNPDRNEKELPTAIRNMLTDYPFSMKGYPLAEHVPDLTSKNDISSMQEYIQEYYK